MSGTPLERAQRALRICDVFMRGATLSVSDSYEYLATDGENFRSQSRHLVERSEILVSEGEGEAKRVLFRVHLDLGFRWGLAAQAPKQQFVTEDEDEKLGFEELGRIEAKYVAEYEITQELASECLDAFALQNASYHVWPYWREFITSSCSRMNVPKQTLPTMQLAQNGRFEAAAGDHKRPRPKKGSTKTGRPGPRNPTQSDES